MKQKTSQTTLITCLTLAAIFFAAFSLYQQHSLVKNIKATELGETFLLPEHEPVTFEDRKPLEIPEHIIKKGKSLTVPILMYHHVGNVPPAGSKDAVRVGLTVNTDNFKQQVAWIKSQGYESISLDDLYGAAQGEKKLPKKPVIFTFDDGYEDVFTNAVPVLRDNGYIGTFAVITSWPGWVNGTNTYATWHQIRLAKDSGMEIVCHTQNHFDGSSKKFDASFIYQNLTGCQKDLTDHLGAAEPYLIYPYGHYTPEYIAQAKKAGFVMGLTVHEGKILNLENLMVLPRVRVNSRETLEQFKEKLLK